MGDEFRTQETSTALKRHLNPSYLLVEIGPLFLEKKLLKCCQCIFAIFPFTQGYFVSSLVEIGPVVLEKYFCTILKPVDPRMLYAKFD